MPARGLRSFLSCITTATGVETSGSFTFNIKNIVRACRPDDIKNTIWSAVILYVKKSMDTFCVIQDDMKPIYPKILEADALVFASPVYWFTVSAQTKLFMDRLYAFLGPEGNSLTDKRIGILLTYGDTDPYTSGAVNAIRTFQDAFAYIGASIVGTVYGSALDEGEIEGSPEVLERAYELGKKLVYIKQSL